MNLVKPFKLVPLHLFEKMKAAAADGNASAASSSTSNDNIDNECDGSKRTIKNIIEANNDDDVINKNNNTTHFKPSMHFVAEFQTNASKNNDKKNNECSQQVETEAACDKNKSDFSNPSSPTKKLKGKGVESNIPVFLPNSDELPEYSKGARIKKTFDNVSNVLNDPTIPESLKIKLYLLLRSKYDMTCDEPETDNIDNGNEISFDSANMV